MFGLPNDMSNQSPYRQSDSPGSGDTPAGGGYYPSEQSFNAVDNHDLNIPFLLSGSQSFEHFMHLGTPGNSYVFPTAGSMVGSSSNLLPMLSGVTSGSHAFPSHYSSLYESNPTTNTSHYRTELTQLQAVNNALFVHSRTSMLHASSPCESDSSFDEPGSGYSSPSMSAQRNSTVSLPSHAETEEYLRNTLEIPSHLPVDLSALPDATDKKQPPITHMIKLAIWGSKDKMLTLRGIYGEIENRYPSLKDLQDKPWQRSIRHNLSLKAIFVRLERPHNMPGSGHYWAINFRNGEGNKRDRKRKDHSSRGSSSRSRSDEEDGFSEDVDEDRSTSVGRRRQGEQIGIRIPRNPYEQYSATPSMFPEASIQTSGMSYRSVVPPSRLDQASLQPLPLQTGSSSSGHFNELPAYSRGMSFPSNANHNPLYRTTYGSIMGIPHQIPFGPSYTQEQLSMPDITSSMNHQIPILGPIPYGQGSLSRRPSPDEDQDNPRKNRRRID